MQKASLWCDDTWPNTDLIVHANLMKENQLDSLYDFFSFYTGSSCKRILTTVSVFAREYSPASFQDTAC